MMKTWLKVLDLMTSTNPFLQSIPGIILHQTTTGAMSRWTPLPELRNPSATWTESTTTSGTRQQSPLRDPTHQEPPQPQLLRILSQVLDLDLTELFQSTDQPRSSLSLASWPRWWEEPWLVCSVPFS